MPGWNTNRKPDGITLYFAAAELTRHPTPNFKDTRTAFLDRITCERLKESIIEAEKEYWEKLRKCPHCQGTGQAVPDETCDTCKGKGRIPEAQFFKEICRDSH